jgi:hypothetical protein
MGLIKGMLWWAYLDDKGVIHVKHYVNDRQLQNCEQMPFCKGIFDVFEAFSREEARQMCHRKLKEVEFHDKRMQQ